MRYRAAARLGLHLYYLCVNRFEGHEPRCLSLADALGINDCVAKVIESCKTSSEYESIQKLREVDIEIKESYGSIASAAFSLSHWISVLIMQAQKMIDKKSITLEEQLKTSPSKRICDELKTLTANTSLVAYAKANFAEWDRVVNANEVSKTVQDIYNRKIILFCDLLNMYTANFNSQHSQSFLLSIFLEKRMPINDLSFEGSAKEILVRRLGQVSIVSGSESFKDIIFKNKKLEVEPNKQLSGRITLHIRNKMHSSNIAPLVEVRTWLKRDKEKEGWREISATLEAIKKISKNRFYLLEKIREKL